MRDTEFNLVLQNEIEPYVSKSWNRTNIARSIGIWITYVRDPDWNP